MNSVIGALRVTLGLDAAAFDKGSDEARRKAGALGAGLKTAIAAAAAAAAVAVGAISVAVKGALDDADEMSKASAKIGIPIGELSQLRYAADLSGVSMAGLSNGIKKLSTNLVEAKDGTKTAVEMLDKAGISATDATGNMKGSSAVLLELADRFAAMPDGVEKSALAVELFGRAGLDLIPLLNGGSEALREMMMEADALGLTLSAETGKAAEQFNDNLSRIGYAAQGVVTQLTASLAPALALISEGLVAAARGLVSMLQYLPTIAEYATVAGVAFATMISPAILAAVGNLTVAIGVGLVGAMRAFTLAIAANPLGALVIGITTAIVAIYHFRDDIQQAIGVDVVGVVKNAANLIINSFRAAFEDIKLLWNTLPSILGAAAIGAVNAVLKAMTFLVEKAVAKINGLVKLANSLLGTIGVDIPEIPLPKFDKAQLDNPYAADVEAAVKDRNAAVAAIMNSDPIGMIGESLSNAWKTAGQSTQALSADVNTLGQSIDTTAGKAGGAGAKAADPWKGLRDSTKKTKDAMSEMEKSASSIGQSIGSSFTEAIKGTKSWRDAALDAIKSVLSSLISSANFGTGVGGSFFKGLFSSLVGFANGGSFQVGGAGGIDSQLVAFKASPNETVSISKPGQRGGGMVYAPVINMDNRGASEGAVARMQRALAEFQRGEAQRVSAFAKARDVRKTRPAGA